MKSVSTLRAVADPAVAAVIERAHQAAVKDALRFIEEHALFTRTGPQGIRQVNVCGLVATAFTHRDSRAGDPDLHTHVAVANKVQTLMDAGWSIDGRVLFKANVAARKPTTQRWSSISARAWGCGLLNGPVPTRRQAADPGDRRCRPTTEPTLVHPPRPHQHPPRRAAIVFQNDHGRPPTRSKRYSWRSRQRWRPATPNTNPDPYLSNAQPGSKRPQPC